MARIEVVIPAKQGMAAQDLARCTQFANELAAALRHTCHQHAIKISSLSDDAYGSEPKISKGATGTPSSDAVQSMVQDMNLSHTELQTRTFLSSEPKNSFGRAHFGYVSEEGMQQWMTKNSKFVEGTDYLYNVSAKTPPNFPISFQGTSKSARPDWRLHLPNSAGEALFDATSPLQKGHLCWKKVNGTTVDQIAKVLYGAEIIYEESDSYTTAFGGGKVKRNRKYTQRWAPY
jgi:hypothetical protein